MKFYIAKKIDGKGDQEVHTAMCNYLPLTHRREYLGEYARCQIALEEAKRRGFEAANGCDWCNYECHINR